MPDRALGGKMVNVMRAARKVSAVAALGTGIVVVGSLGVAGAATGGNFVLGHANTANHVSVLKNTAGTPLSLVAPAGKAPLAVNRPVKVMNLNADRLDGLDSTRFQRKIPAIVWHNITLTNSWANYGAGTYGSNPQFTKDAFGFVHLRGVIDGTLASGQVFATLPTGYRPPQGAWTSASGTNGSGDVHIYQVFADTTGNVYVVADSTATNAFVSLEGVTFYVG